MNVPLETVQSTFENNFIEKLFVSEPIAIGFNKVKNPDFHNFSLDKEGNFKYLCYDCFEWFINEMLEIELYMEKYF